MNTNDMDKIEFMLSKALGKSYNIIINKSGQELLMLYSMGELDKSTNKIIKSYIFSKEYKNIESSNTIIKYLRASYNTIMYKYKHPYVLTAYNDLSFRFKDCEKDKQKNSLKNLIKELNLSPQSSHELEEVLNNKPFNELKFHQKLLRFINENNIDYEKFTEDTKISISYLYKILNGEKTPKRDVIIRFAFALKLGPDETTSLLESAGYCRLDPDKKRDLITIYSLMNKNDIEKLNIFLSKMKLVIY